MDAQKVDMFIMANGKFFESHQVIQIRDRLLTCGGLGIWTIIDWFMIMGATREKNLARLQQVLY